MATLRGRCVHYIFILWFLLSSLFFFYFPRLISAVGDWMSTILPHGSGDKTPCPFLRTPLSVSQTKHSLHTFHQCTQDGDVNVCFRATGTKLTDCQVLAFIETLIYRRHKLVKYFIANVLCVMLGNNVLVIAQFAQPAQHASAWKRVINVPPQCFCSDADTWATRLKVMILKAEGSKVHVQ